MRSFLSTVLIVCCISLSARADDDAKTDNECSVEQGDGFIKIVCRDSTALLYDGQDGSDGSDGQDGEDGIDGSNGMNGTNGRDGINGTNGENGQDGINGYNGSDGKDGDNGVAGDDNIYTPGVNCDVNDNGDGTCTLTCGDSEVTLYQCGNRIEPEIDDSSVEVVTADNDIRACGAFSGAGLFVAMMMPLGIARFRRKSFDG